MTRKTALITGSTGGIGQAAAARLDALGYRLVLIDRDPAPLARQAALYRGAETHRLDLTDRTARREFCAGLEARRDIDVALINAGMIEIGPVTAIAWEAIEMQMDVNLIAAQQMIQALARAMTARGQGHLIATVSMGAITALKGSAAYSASKFGLRGFLWALGDELRGTGVHVTGLYPAGVDTPMLRHEALEGGSNLNFLGTPVSADDVAGAMARALIKPRLEVYVPWSESVLGRLSLVFPWMLGPLYPLLEKIGERGRQAYIARTGIG